MVLYTNGVIQDLVSGIIVFLINCEHMVLVVQRLVRQFKCLGIESLYNIYNMIGSALYILHYKYEFHLFHFGIRMHSIWEKPDVVCASVCGELIHCATGRIPESIIANAIKRWAWWYFLRGAVVWYGLWYSRVILRPSHSERKHRIKWLRWIRKP